jgi:hypothetical protein
MALPKIQTPVFDIVIPSLNKPIEFRPFLVKEEKILLMARQSEDERDMVKAIIQIINNCAIGDINIKDLTMVDIEYLFLKLRAKSVNNIVEVVYIDGEDEKEYKFEIDLDKVEVVQEKRLDNNIKFDNGYGVIMKYPSASIVDNMKQFDNEMDILDFFIRNSIVEIYDEDNVYPIAEQTEQEVKEFIDDLDIQSFEKIREYLDSAPTLNYVIKYTNSLGTDKEIILDTLRDFFILR